MQVEVEELVAAPAAPVRAEPEDEVDPLDAFMEVNSTNLVRDDDDLRQKQQKQQDEQEEVDPLDAFMANQVLPLVAAAGPDQAPMVQAGPPGGRTPSLIAPAAPLRGSGAAAPPVRGRPPSGKAKAAAARRRQQNSSDESSSDEEDEEESSEEDDAVIGLGPPLLMHYGCTFLFFLPSDCMCLDLQEWARLVNAGKMSKGDKLGPVDHDTVDYPPFRKNFYIEVPELAKLGEEDVVALRKDLDGIKVGPCRVW